MSTFSRRITANTYGIYTLQSSHSNVLFLLMQIGDGRQFEEALLETRVYVLDTVRRFEAQPCMFSCVIPSGISNCVHTKAYKLKCMWE